jgi:hypothetical protein
MARISLDSCRSPLERASAGTRFSPRSDPAAWAVYRARDTQLQREVAIKILPADLAADPAHVERFRPEARAVAALSHPNIVTIHSVEGPVRLGRWDDVRETVAVIRRALPDYLNADVVRDELARCNGQTRCSSMHRSARIARRSSGRPAPPPRAGRVELAGRA